jgi:hypothetical protein
MEALTRMVADSLARHGFDSSVDPRRLQWSRWFRCDSPHSLLVVPSKPGIFAIAEEVMDLGPDKNVGTSKVHVGTVAQACHEPSRRGRPAERSSAAVSSTSSAAESTNREAKSTNREGHDFSRAGITARNSPALAAAAPLGGAALQRCDSERLKDAASAAEVPTRRMLAVIQFSEDDDMAFTLDRMFTRANPMRDRFATGRCFLRFVVIEDQTQRRTICSALNQWVLYSAEKASGLSASFQSSLELTDLGRDRVGRTLPSTSSEPALSVPKGQALSGNADTVTIWARGSSSSATENLASPSLEVPLPHLDSGAHKNLHCPHSLPSGF